MTALVLLPGMDGTGHLFTPLLQALSPAIAPQVVAYPTHQCLGYRELAAHVEAVLPADGDYVLLGESFSGPVAIALAAGGCARLRGLILACSFASTPRPALASLRPLARLLPSPRLALAPLCVALMGWDATPALRASLAAALTAVDPKVLRHRAAAALAVDVTPDLARVACPVLYLQALGDRVIPARCATQVQRACPHAEVERLPGPHFLLQTRAAQAAARIEYFVRRSCAVA